MNPSCSSPLRMTLALMIPDDPWWRWTISARAKRSKRRLVKWNVWRLLPFCKCSQALRSTHIKRFRWRRDWRLGLPRIRLECAWPHHMPEVFKHVQTWRRRRFEVWSDLLTLSTDAHRWLQHLLMISSRQPEKVYARIHMDSCKALSRMTAC